jgi:hypothetical protein
LKPKTRRTLQQPQHLSNTFSDRADTTSNSALDASKVANDAADKAQKKFTAVSKRADDIEERLKLALSMLSVRSVRNLEGMKYELKLYPWPQHVVIKSYSGDLDGFGVCIELGFAMSSPETGMNVRIECGHEPLTLPLTVTGITISWPDVFTIYRLRHLLIGDGGLGDVSNIQGCWPCRIDEPQHPTEMELFIGLNPGFSLARLEDAERKLKKQPTKQSVPKP